MARHYCRHRLLELYDGEHHCVDCDKKFDIVPIAYTYKKASERRIEEPPEEKRNVTFSCLWPVLFGVAALMVTGGLYFGQKRVTRTIEVEKIIEKRVEVPVEVIKEVYLDRICPDTPIPPPVKQNICHIPEPPTLSCPKCPDVNVQQAECKPEIVYVPQKANCVEEIQSACGEYKEGVRWLIEKGRIPQRGTTESYDEGDDDWDGELN